MPHRKERSMKIDLTPVFQSIIALLAALVTYKFIPWIRSKVTEQQFANLEAAARVAVYAAEQIFKNGDNGKKLDYAIDQVVKAGFDLDLDTIRAAVEQAVYELKAERQLADSFKQRIEDKETEEDAEGEIDYHIVPLEDWPLEMIQTFCEDNGINADGCVSKTDFINAIVKGGRTEPPDSTEEETLG